MKIENINTLGELKASGYKSNSIEELRTNLRAKIKSGEPAFEGVHGFENTVIPELERHIIASQHQFIGTSWSGQNKVCAKNG
jgi:magnesium chelatase subunit I